MKNLFLFFSLLSVLSLNAQVGIGTGTPDSKAILDLTSTSKGLLFPRLTSAQRNAIASPPQGLVIFNTNSGSAEVYGKTYEPSLLKLSTSSSASSTGGEDAWQQFTPATSGLLTKIELLQRNPTTGQSTAYPYKMNIYANATTWGSGVTGDLLGSAVAYIPTGVSSATYISYDFDSPVYLQSGTQYIFQIVVHDGAISAPFTDTYLNASDVYAGNDTWVGGFNRDLCFKIYIKKEAGNGWLNLNY